MRPYFVSPLLLACAAVLWGCNRAPQDAQHSAKPAASEGTSLVTSARETLPSSTNNVALSPAQNNGAAVVSATNPPSPAPEKGTRLRMKWTLGRRYIYRFDLDQHSTNRVADLPKTRNEDLALGLTYALTVQNGADAGHLQLQAELLAFEISIKLGGLSAMAFDSAAPPSPPDPITAPFGKIAGTKIQLRLDADGKVERVEGRDQWLAHVVGDDQGPAEEMIRQQFNDGFFRQMADFGRSFPPNPVDVGDNWPYRTDVPAGALGTIQANTVISFVRLEPHEQHTLAVLQAKGSLKGVAPPGPNNPGDLKLEQGTTSSTTWFDPAEGDVLEAVVEQSMQLGGELAGSGGTLAGPTTFISDIDQKITLKLVE